MKRGKLQRMGVAGLLLCGLILCGPASAKAAKAPPATLRIGVLKSLFHGLPPSLINIISRPLRVLMKLQTGMEGEIRLVDNPAMLAVLLQKNEIQLGVMHGFELGWAREANKSLQPLIIAIRKHVQLRVCLVVHKSCGVTDCASLKGKIIAVPRKSRAHCRLYLERRCPNATTSPTSFFSKIESPSQAESALDDVVAGRLDAALVEREVLESFAQSKPMRYADLRVIQESEPFPAGVLVYHPGNIDDSTLQRFRSGLKSASKTSKGQRLLRTCRINQFLEVPSDFEDLLSTIMKAYPPPKGE